MANPRKHAAINPSGVNFPSEPKWEVQRRSTVLFFDMRIQPRQCIVPLLGYLIEIIPNLLDRLRFEL